MDNSNAAVQGLRTFSDTLSDVFTYSVQDTAGAVKPPDHHRYSRVERYSYFHADNAVATEAGGLGNSSAGVNPTAM